jgi:hypothetical protein
MKQKFENIYIFALFINQLYYDNPNPENNDIQRYININIDYYKEKSERYLGVEIDISKLSLEQLDKMWKFKYGDSEKLIEFYDDLVGLENITDYSPIIKGEKDPFGYDYTRISGIHHNLGEVILKMLNEVSDETWKRLIRKYNLKELDI